MTRELPLHLVDAVERAAAAIAEHSAALGHRVELDALAELGRRDAIEASAHDRSRLVPTADGWLAVNLARPDDADLVPAWLSPWLDPERVGGDPWSAIRAVGRRVGAADLLAGAIGLGLPVARVGERPPLGQAQLGGTSFAPAAGTRRRRHVDELHVVDLGSLWAGPLCGAIFARTGATVTKVESVGRPDGLRVGAPELFEHLNAGKQVATLDPTTEAGREELRALVAGADVVIEASRPRALQQLGIEVGDHLGQPGGPQLWVSITGYGRSEGERVAFGDVAAAAGGLVAWDEAGVPAFLGDALADPLAGLAAAAAALAALDRGDAGLLDVSMADVAASVARPPPAGRRDRPRSRRPGATAASTLRFDDVEVDGRRCSVLVADGAIAAVADSVDAPAAAQRIDGRGGALLPGLHDHHVHLAATAARARSVSVGPPAVRSTDDLGRVLTAAARQLPPGVWLRAVDHHASAGGDLDRDLLDRLVPDRPVRIQDATGARWTVNSLGADALGLDAAGPDGIERDGSGRPTGRLHRLDEWLRSRLPAAEPLPFAELGRRLASWGVTGVTDATPYETTEGFDLLAGAVGAGDLPQRVTVTGGIQLAAADPPPDLLLGPVKLLIDDGAYPSLDELARSISVAHATNRAVAIHCVTRVALVLALAAFDLSGTSGGDRIEHGSVIPLELVGALRRHRLTVVTQPAFVAERGDRYLTDVDRDDVDHLYRCGSLLGAGVRVAAGTDAPHADGDPWRSIAAAVSRTTPDGRVLGAHERVPAATALGLFLGAPADPGGPARRVEVGAPADLCLLHVPLREALADPSSSAVRLTVAGGDVRFVG